MKTYIYYSKSNKEVIAVIADSRFEADTKLLEDLNIQGRIIKDNYVLMTTVDKTNIIGGFIVE